MNTLKITTLLVLLASFALFAGCSKAPEPGSEPSASPSAATEPATEPKGAALGTEQPGDHFTITLSAEPAELKAGKAKFSARVLHHGEPASGATVKLILSMPEMGHGGPEPDMKETSPGLYEAEVELGMAGAWRAKVAVDQQGHPGEAVYDFDVKE